MSLLGASFRSLSEELIPDSNVDVKLSKALTEQESLKAQLQDVQETLANRSSATESGERDMALFQAQAREAEMRTRINNLRDEYDSIESMSSLKLAEAEEKESRLSRELQTLQSEHALSVDNVRALQSTIDILRSRIQESLEAAQEHTRVRERLVEVEAMLQTTSQTLERHAAHTEYRTAVIRELQGEIHEMSRRLGFAEIEYEVLLETSQTDQQTYDNAVIELQQRMSISASEAERRLEIVKSEHENARDTLRNEISTLRDNLSAVELSLQESTDTLKVSEDRVGKLRALLHEREKEVTLLRTSMAEIGRPVDGTALQLREEIAQLEARIERRNRQIALEQEKARKLAMNLELAQDTLEEQDNAIQNVKEVLADCQEQKLGYETQIVLLKNQNAELVDKIQQMTGDTKCQQEKHNIIFAEQQDELLRSDITQHHLILQLVIHRSKRAQASLASDASSKQIDRLVFDISAARLRGQQATSMLRKTVEQHEQERRDSEMILEALQIQKQSLATELDVLRAELDVAVQGKTQTEASSEKAIEELRNVVNVQRQEAALAQTEINNTRNETTTLKELLNQVENDKMALTRTAEEAQVRILQLEQSMVDTNNRLDENQSAMESDVVRQESKLMTELDRVQTECVALQQTIHRLEQELDAAKQWYDSSLTASKETEAVLILAKEGAEEEMTRRASERDNLCLERDALSTQLAAVQQALKQQQEARKNSEEQLQEAANDIRQKYEAAAESLAASSAQVSQLEATLEIAEDRCLQLSGEVHHAQDKLAVVQEEVETNQRRLVEVEQERSELAARVDSLEKTVAALRENETRLFAENEATRSDVAAKSTSLVELEAVLQARQLDVESLHKSHADGLQELRSALETTKRELEHAQEGQGEQ